MRRLDPSNFLPPLLITSKDLAAAEVLRKYDAKVNDLFHDHTPEVKAITEAKEKRESDVLETARLDGGWTMRERARLKFEMEEGLRKGDEYDRHWLKKRGPLEPVEDQVEVNPEDMEYWRNETAYLTREAGGTIKSDTNVKANGEVEGRGELEDPGASK